MSFLGLETSIFGGTPVELYEFRLSTVSWRYCSGQKPVIYSGQTYVPTPIKHSEIVDESGKDTNGLTITAPFDLDIGTIWMAAPPSEVVQLFIYERHLTDPDNEFQIKWMGRVLNAKWTHAELELQAESTRISAKRMGLRRRNQVSCPYALYGNGCNVNNLAFEVSGPCTLLSGVQISVPAIGSAGKPDGWFVGGYATWVSDTTGIVERRSIIAHVGSTVTFDTTAVGLSSTDTVKLYPGCDRTLATCVSKFNNVINYGGLPWVPTKNPFGSNPVF